VYRLKLIYPYLSIGPGDNSTWSQEWQATVQRDSFPHCEEWAENSKHSGSAYYEGKQQTLQNEMYIM